MTTSIRKRACLFAACLVLSTSAIALADGGTQNGGGQDPPTTPPGHDAQILQSLGVVDALVQALPIVMQTLLL